MNHDDKKPGRKSAASLTTVQSIGVERTRPRPPDHMPAEQAEVWKSIVDAMPSDWFGSENVPLLAAYSGHIVDGRRVARLIENYHEAGEADIKKLNRLLIMQARESAAIAALARSMRLTHQARIDPKTAGRKLGGMPRAAPPWEPKPPHLSDGEGGSDE